MSTIYEKNKIRRAINASGRMTALGVSTVHDDACKAMVEAAQNYVVIDELIDRVGELITPYTGAEDTCVTSSASAAMALSVAGVITKGKLSLLEKLPHTEGVPNEVILQKGQSVNYGAPVTQMILLGGGVPVEVGAANAVKKEHIEEAINEKTVALFYVKSHHCVQKGMVSLKDMVAIAHAHDLPVIVDASAEEDLKTYIATGADMVCYSGAKAIEGPTSGFVTGKKQYINWAKRQYKGIGRAMKVGKECMMGLVAAIQIYATRDEEAHYAVLEKTVEELKEALSGIPGIALRKSVDEAGRKICRLQMDVLPQCPYTAQELTEKLKAGNPGIYTRDHFANVGTLFFDPRPLCPGDIACIAQRMKELLQAETEELSCLNG